jgi:hypothetical protein
MPRRQFLNGTPHFDCTQKKRNNQYQNTANLYGSLFIKKKP